MFFLSYYLYSIQFSYYNMERGKTKEVSEDKKTQFRWAKPMLKELLRFLVDEVKKGNRPNNNFKSSSFVGAADMISKKFNVKCLLDHVDNHLRTVKTASGIIAKLRNQSGCGWDENMRMIRMSPDVYNTYVEVLSFVTIFCFLLLLFSRVYSRKSTLSSLVPLLLLLLSWKSNCYLTKAKESN